MKTDIWMPIFIGDYLSATTRLTTQQHGAYFLLLMDYWKNGRPPDDDEVLAQITKMTPDAWSNARRILLAYFQIENGYWVQKRIEKELVDSKNRKESAVQRAKTGAEARWKKKNDASSIAQAMLNPMLENATSPSPSPSSLSLPSTSTSKKNSDKKATRLLDDWELPDEWAIWAKKARPELNVNEIADGFKDYWLSQAGVKGRKADWFATWRNWIRNQKVFAKDRNNDKSNQQAFAPVTFAERDEQNRRKKWEEMTGLQWPDNNSTVDTTFTRIEQ